MLRWVRGWSSGGSRGWWTAFALFFVLGVLWSFASPLFSVADEPGHVVRAVAVGRGQFGGSERDDFPDHQVRSTVQVPALYSTATSIPSCYIGQTNVAASCAPALEGSTKTAAVLTQVGRYPPAYYVAVGLASRPFSAVAGVHVMRMVTAAIAAALLASAFASARAVRDSNALTLGLALAVTPMLLFLAGGVNPSGVEIASAIALWTSLVALVLLPSMESRARLAARVGIAGSVLVLSRQLGPLLAALIVVTVVLFAGPERLRALWREKAVRAWTGAIAICTVVAVAWIVGRHTLSGIGGTPPSQPLSDSALVQTSLGNTGGNVLQMIGSFGWTDTPAPLLTYYVWFALLGFVVLLSILNGTVRQLTLLAGLVTVVIVLPVAFEASHARDIGFVWLGRYTLPLAAGIPILAAVASRDAIPRLGWRLSPTVATLLATAQLAAFVWALRRFTGSLNLVNGGTWSPPGSSLLLVIAFAGATACYGWWLWRSLAPTRRTGS